MAIDLSRRPEWALVFADDAGLLFVDRDRYPVAAARLGYHYWSPDYQRMGELAMKAMADRALERGFEAELERARAESPWHSRATLWLGLLRLAAGDAHGAATLLDEVERLAPVTPGLALRQGMARERIGDEAGARAAYRRALSEPADSAAARAALARLEVGR
jgi:lipopolysaccharide biosynthesis regulator YciM